ncbi:precorrin-6A synthase (deacetylating) [Sedimentitalea arenosa]|uniref:Precorrin-6A synthase [deacetylating] n=1 Tax=Sedimentitalea arenosa TaxID=2798803 RepID=A0A8J7LVC0_9RHOB|nr:precorrin-6A synthase (deacetylating) [Arenibacterium arenosum]MBJ6370860.1 precorrin-6A synthase (deacetylating) [Arenibacterium arenosum]
MVELSLIGIGTGNPDHVTRQGEAAIRAADLILIPRKGAAKSDLAELRETIIAHACDGTPPRIAHFDIPERRTEDGYLQGVEHWHDAIARAWQAAIAGETPSPRRVALLIWGDPSLYDSSLRIFARLDPRPLVRVIPGITALQALTAAHAIPINEIGAPFVVTTGRRLREDGWPPAANTVAVMLDGTCAFRTLPPADYDIWWGAYLGMAEERLIHGPLTQVADRIEATRAAARADHGWIMDVYLLKKRPAAPA